MSEDFITPAPPESPSDRRQRILDNQIMTNQLLDKLKTYNNILEPIKGAISVNQKLPPTIAATMNIGQILNLLIAAKTFMIYDLQLVAEAVPVQTPEIKQSLVNMDQNINNVFANLENSLIDMIKIINA